MAYGPTNDPYSGGTRSNSDSGQPPSSYGAAPGAPGWPSAPLVSPTSSVDYESASLRRARTLLRVLGVWGIIGVLLLGGLYNYAAGESNASVPLLAWLLLAVSLAQAIAYLAIAGRVGSGVAGAVTAATVLVGFSLALRVIGAFMGSTNLLSLAIGGGLEIWLLVSLNSADAKAFVRSRR